MAMKAGGKKHAKLRRADNFMKEAPRIAGRLTMYMVAVIVIGLLFSSLQAIDSQALRSVITAVLSLVLLAFFYMEGLNKGSGDAGSSRQAARLLKAGRELTVKEDAACYHPLKAVCGAALLFVIPLALAAYVALTTQEYTYTLQDLPGWLSGGYGSREDVMGGLGAYMQPMETSVRDWIRIVARLFVLMFINFFGDPQRAGALIDRLTPLFILLYPLAYIIGYLRGPAENVKLEKMNKKAKKVAVRKQQKSKLVDELLGENHVPHYGHQREKDKPKKKELI